ILLRLADMIPTCILRTAEHGDQPTSETFVPAPIVDLPAGGPLFLQTAKTESVPEEQKTAPTGIPLSRSHLVLLVTVAALIALVLGYLLAPWIQGINARRADTKAPALVVPVAKASAVPIRNLPTNLDELRKVAAQGDPDAQYALGTRYAVGEEVPQDFGEAVRWFMPAAEHGHASAQATLGAYYWAGRGVPKDLNKAYFWVILARAQGDKGSEFRAESLESSMTRTEVLAVQQQADEWLKQHQIAATSAAAP